MCLLVLVRRSISSQRCSMRFRLELCAGHQTIVGMPIWRSHHVTELPVEQLTPSSLSKNSTPDLIAPRFWRKRVEILGQYIDVSVLVQGAINSSHRVHSGSCEATQIIADPTSMAYHIDKYALIPQQTMSSMSSEQSTMVTEERQT